MKIYKHFLTFCLLGLTLSIFAYDGVGHRIIADIAYNNLTGSARTRVDKVLGKRGMVYASTWADDIRSDKKYAYSYPWHYQDLNDNLTSDDLKKLLDHPTEDGEHLFFAIGSMKMRLKKDKNDAEALKFLIHFIGDLHQPLHLGRKDDMGGNKIEMNWFGRKTNLHSVWDGALIDSEKMSFSEFSRYLQDKFEPRKADFKKCSLLQSVEASYAVRNSIYAYNTTDTSNYHYLYFFAGKRDEMLYRGGIQLANILNAIYK